MTRHPVTRPTTSPARSHATLPSGSAPASTPANTRPGAAGPAGAAVPPRPAGGFGGNPAPSYPEEARQRGWEGRVVLRVRVTADGRPASVAVSGSSGYHALDQAALSAVRRWRFRPARRAGLAVAGTVTIPIRFRLRR